MACALCPPAARRILAPVVRETLGNFCHLSRGRTSSDRPTDRDREECQSFRLARPLARSFLRPSELMAERQDRNLGPTKFRSWWGGVDNGGEIGPSSKILLGPTLS